MYNILSTRKIHTIIEKYPNKKQEISFNEAKAMRQKLGCGIYLCMQLLRKTETLDEAITLYHNIMTESADIKHKKIIEPKEPMTEENKNLLLQDLCKRLPYGVKCNVGEETPYTLNKIEIDNVNGHLFDFVEKKNGLDMQVYLSEIKPYLFPLSSMDKKQKKYIRDNNTFGATHELFDWFDKNHFDYRGLIEKGLAIDATNLNIY